MKKQWQMYDIMSEVQIFFTAIDRSLWVQMYLMMLAETGQINLTGNNPGLTSDKARLEVDFSYDKQTENCLHIEQYLYMPIWYPVTLTVLTDISDLTIFLLNGRLYCIQLYSEQ